MICIFSALFLHAETALQNLEKWLDLELLSESKLGSIELGQSENGLNKFLLNSY